MKNIDISFIIPCYQSRFIVKTVNSIFSAKNFNVNFEILICVLSPDDLSLRLLKDANMMHLVRVAYSSNFGVTANRNAGIRNANGKFLYFLDSDDTILPTFFETFLSLTSFSFDMAFVNGINFSPTPQNSTLLICTNYDYFFSDRSKIQFSYCTYIFLRDFIVDNQLFVDETITNCEDYLFIGMCLDKRPLLLITPYYTFEYSVLPSSLSKKNQISDCISAFASFDCLLSIILKNQMPLSLKRYGQILTNSILDKPIFLSKSEQKECIKRIKKTNIRKFIFHSVCSLKKISYITFGFFITWKLLKIKSRF